MGQPVVHFEVIGQDGAQLQSFYRQLFGWTIDADNPLGYGLVDTSSGGTGIPGGVAAAQPGSGSRVTFYVEVPDIGAALASAEQLGGRRLWGPAAVIEGLELGQFADPDGNVIGLRRLVA
jgi:predicted enzyme related to lactoylglutathione lyase